MTVIAVTQAHIDTGVRESCIDCPIALAVNERLKHVYFANIGGKSCQIDVLGGWFVHGGHIKLPRAVQDWIIDYDAGAFLSAPISFDLPIPVECLK